MLFVGIFNICQVHTLDNILSQDHVEPLATIQNLDSKQSGVRTFCDWVCVTFTAARSLSFAAYASFHVIWRPESPSG
jgi:hypothetical protein